jgi:hypothetical protein
VGHRIVAPVLALGTIEKPRPFRGLPPGSRQSASRMRLKRETLFGLPRGIQNLLELQKSPETRALLNEADGTRTRNIRIDRTRRMKKCPLPHSGNAVFLAVNAVAGASLP